MTRARAQDRDGSVCRCYSMSACAGGYVHHCFSTQVCRWVHVLVYVGPSTFFLFWHCLSTALVKHPGTSRQYSGEPTPCQEQFGASAEISPCRGAVMEGKSKTPTWLAELPLSWKKSLVTWPDFTHFTKKPQQKMELPAAVQYGVISFLPQAQGLCMSHCICYTVKAVLLSTRVD